jgi:hypothetical protein
MERTRHLSPPDADPHGSLSVAREVIMAHDVITAHDVTLSLSKGAVAFDDPSTYERNVENFIGTVRYAVLAKELS